MKLDFDFSSVTITEFGVGRDDEAKAVFYSVPVDSDVQDALQDIANATWKLMQSSGEPAQKYEPSEKHASTEYLYLDGQHELAASLSELHSAKNLAVDTGALDSPEGVFCYFARLKDKKGRRLTAIRRATHFKGVLRKRLIHWLSDAMKMVEDDIFKLDNDFDLLIDSKFVHIWRPSGFEFVGGVQHAILDAVPGNIQVIKKDLPFVQFDAIEAYAKDRPRAARYVASIRSQELKNIDKASLKALCGNTNVEVREVGGKITIGGGSEMGFLEVLDRRRYEVSLVKNQPERFRAASRTRLKG